MSRSRARSGKAALLDAPWSRVGPSNRAASATRRPWRVIPDTASAAVTPFAVRSRTRRNTCPTAGHPASRRYSFRQVVVVIVRRPIRPCP